MTSEPNGVIPAKAGIHGAGPLWIPAYAGMTGRGLRISCHCFFFIAGLVLSTNSAFAWDGFVWETWHEITGVEKPDIKSPQAGEADLVPLMLTEGPGSKKIETIQEWETK
ncbi:MAG: hypothetical protein KC994_03710, partial [Candidatus Omnitrophica bacterium]|nr:hypothetical protein [Candidatus Omnitrophota bacterium]